MKKMLTAVLAILMLAGALCAISGATSVTPLPSMTVVGEGASPFPAVLSPNASERDVTSLNSRF